ncbi:MAG TPA: tetratricopeptide repeat protein [Pyrinomonadaceae bacterium]|nr:tetratricopeptide repeat protein [Pyrinomonadaceae bacterium]HET9787884.1 tetratricopeptide repeat protein [Pyrinomonadaceae bacterium]
MKKRRLIAILIAFILTAAVTAMWSATTLERDGDPDANLIEDSGTFAGEEVSEEGGEVVKKKGGNKVARILAAPFKAFGRLFKGKDNRLQRMSESDAEKFESVGVSRVDDSRYPDAPRLSSSATAKEHLESGRTFLQEGRLNEAIAELSTAASLDRKLGEAHNLLGVAYTQKGLQDRAKDSYERAVKVEPDDAQTLNNLGFSLYQNGHYRAAIDRLKRAVKLAPRDERILNNLGLALCRVGKFEEAYKNFARAGGELTGNLNIAKMLERFGREEDAIKYYEDARRVDPRSTIALRRLADLYKRVGRIEESETAKNALAAISAEANVAVSGK